MKSTSENGDRTPMVARNKVISRKKKVVALTTNVSAEWKVNGHE